MKILYAALFIFLLSLNLYAKKYTVYICDENLLLDNAIEFYSKLNPDYKKEMRKIVLKTLFLNREALKSKEAKEKAYREIKKALDETFPLYKIIEELSQDDIKSLAEKSIKDAQKRYKDFYTISVDAPVENEKFSTSKIKTEENYKGAKVDYGATLSLCRLGKNKLDISLEYSYEKRNTKKTPVKTLNIVDFPKREMQVELKGKYTIIANFLQNEHRSQSIIIKEEDLDAIPKDDSASKDDLVKSKAPESQYLTTDPQ